YQERVQDTPSPSPSLEEAQMSSNHSSSVSSSPLHNERTAETTRTYSPVLPALPAGLHHTPFIFPEGLSSIETLLTNIQGLLRVAIENARAQEKQDQLERTELKMELVRERELRETLERQLSMEQKNRVLIQKRLKKEKRSKRKLQEALEEEVKLRDQAEHTLLHTVLKDFTARPLLRN
uniref:Dachshund d n=1 Tax=Xiphophorus couchianus TaxID=32473 RepID=A0A3B5LQR3_9TELE